MEGFPVEKPETGKEVVEREQFYILVNKESKEIEDVVSATLPEIKSEPVHVDEIANPTHFVRGESEDPLYTNVDRARNQLGLDSEKYALFGPYDSEESAKEEAETDYSDAPVNAIEELIKRDEVRMKERKERDRDQEEAKEAA